MGRSLNYTNSQQCSVQCDSISTAANHIPLILSKSSHQNRVREELISKMTRDKDYSNYLNKSSTQQFIYLSICPVRNQIMLLK